MSDIDYSGKIADADLQVQQVKAVFVTTVTGTVVSGAAVELASFATPLVDRQAVGITNLDATNKVFIGIATGSGLTTTLLGTYRLGEWENAVIQVSSDVELWFISDAGEPTITINQIL